MFNVPTKKHTSNCEFLGFDVSEQEKHRLLRERLLLRAPFNTKIHGHVLPPELGAWDCKLA